MPFFESWFMDALLLSWTKFENIVKKGKIIYTDASNRYFRKETICQ